MILDGSYATAIDRDYQHLAATAPITSLSITDDEFSPAYWIGWSAWENVPSFWHISRYTITDDLAIFTDVTAPENVDVLLSSTVTTRAADLANMSGNVYLQKYGNTWAAWNNLVNSGLMTAGQRFFNKCDVNTQIAQNVTIYFLTMIDGATYSMYIGNITPAEIYNGDFTRSVTSADLTLYGGAAIPSDISFDISAAEMDGAMHTATVGGHTITYAAIWAGCTGYVRPINYDGTNAAYYIVPTSSIKIHDTDGAPFIVGGNMAFAGAPTSLDSSGGIRITPATGAINLGSGGSVIDDHHDEDTTTIAGGFSGSFSIAAMYDALGSDAFGIFAPDGCNFFIHGSSILARGAVIRRYCKWSDVLSMASYQMRFGSSNTYATDSSKYYAKISTDHEFLGELANGETDRADLRPWQIAGFSLDAATDTYNTDDKPPYTPGDDDAPQNVGASISRPSTLGVGGTSGFITQYVLTAAEIATLGRTLWTSFINPDYWRNFLFSLALDTGSFDMSSLLDYFVSLRVYPFSLINVPSYAATGSPSIYIGSGIVPLTITGSATLHTINNFADYIDAGSCVVHSAYFHDDFRDYSNVEIMLYLPYCGTVQLNPGDVIGGTLHAQYAIDFATGGCVAYVDLTSADGISYPIAVLPGSIGADVPLTATNAGQIAARFAGDVINFASTVSSNAASDLNARVNAATGAITGGASGAVSKSSIGAIATGGINAGLQHASQALDMATRPAIGIPTLSGGRGFSSFGAPQTAYIQIRRGIYKRPQTYDHTVGAPASTSKTIGSLAGLVKGAVDTAGLSCTADEAAEVRTLIAAGIII